MKKLMISLKNFGLLFFLIFTFNESVEAQNYSVQESISYINETLGKPEVKISYLNNKFISKDYLKKSGAVGTLQEIYISDISKVTVGESPWGDKNSPGYCAQCVYIRCIDDSSCTNYTFPNGKQSGMPYFSVVCNNINDADKISNALRYIIEKVGKSEVKDDPFASYSVEKKDNSTININDLYVGMSKNMAFKILNTKPTVDLIENGYEVYKVKKKDQYFLYFTNNRLTRVDKGVSMVDAIIIIN
jgi:hypothetical protein